MAFGDVFAGYMGQATQHYNNLLQMDYQQKRDLASQYAKLAEDPRYAPEQQQEFRKRALTIPTMEPMKKLPKEWENMMIQVRGAQQPQGIQAPTPTPPGGAGPLPPSPLMQQGAQVAQPSMMTPLMQPMSFPEQVEHERQSALAKGAPAITDTIIKSVMGNKIGQYPTVDPQNGEAYQMLRFRGVDPGSIDLNDLSKIRYREWEERSGLPLRPFAPRAVSAAGLSAEDVMNAVTNDVPLQFDHKPTPEEMAKVTAIMPNAKLIPTGPNQWYVAAQHWNNKLSANGHVLLFPDTPSTNEPFHKYVDAGVATGALPKYTGTATVPPGISPETGLRTPGVTNRTQTTGVPGAGAPAVAPQFITTPPGMPGAPTPPPGPSSIPGPQSAAPPVTSPAAAPAPIAPPAFGPQGAKPAMPSAPPSVTPKQFEDAQKAGTGMRGIAQAISGDAASLENYAPLAANPQLRGQMATVFQTLQDTLNAHSDDPNFNVAMGLHFGIGGNLGKILGNVSGVNQAAIQSEVNRIQNVLTQGITAGGSPAINRKAQNAVSAVMALFAVLPAMRNISGNPVYRSSMNRLELEIPTFFNVGSAQEVYQKLGLISRELSVAGTNQDLQRYLGKDEVQKWSQMRDRFLKMGSMSNDELYRTLTNASK